MSRVAALAAACLVELIAAVGPGVNPPAPSDTPVVRVSINRRVTSLDLEEYVARVVAGEGQPRAADGAQQALAITARTYALANLNRHRREGYDLCDTTHCQVLRAPTDAARRAALATADRVLTFQGQPASVYYSALCGGHSELASAVWPGAADYSSQSQEDEACRDEPGWVSEIEAKQIEAALRDLGHRGSRLRGLRVASRNQSGRVARLRVEGFSPVEVSGHDFRTALVRVVGPQQLKSTAFDVRRSGSRYRFVGTGYGHGVGLCVIGAGKRAAQGGRADQILAFYFPTLTLTSLGSVSTRVAARPASPPSPSPSPTRPPPSAARDVVITLPNAQEAERIAITDIVRAARNQIAAKSGLDVPGAIQVTVHPSVEAFVRATGQPWWVSGAADGGRIDLPPVSIMRQRGQFERSLRHEVAHLIVDGALSERPMWVREGAAFYFADPDAASETTVRGGCPRDDELLRPVSAGAHRTALSRADACFRRAVASGRPWSQVR